MEYLTSLQVDSLKGIRNLMFPNFSSVNLFTGPNGSGKSTVMDAIELICNPQEVLQYMKVAKYSPNIFRNLFDKKESRPYIRISGNLLGKHYITELTSCENSSHATFRGIHHYQIPKGGKIFEHSQAIEFSLTEGFPKINLSSLLNVKRISANAAPISLENIANDKTIKEKVLSLLSLFDNRFSDIHSPDFRRTYAIHEIYNQIDIHFFSDGILKILGILDGMCCFQNGILILDDLETHLSPKTLYEVISLLSSLAKEKHLQLFITTHSQELIDEFLDLMNFYNELEQLKIFRMKSNGESSDVTEFSGKEAYELRLEKEVDFRYEYPKKGE